FRRGNQPHASRLSNVRWTGIPTSLSCLLYHYWLSRAKAHTRRRKCHNDNSLQRGVSPQWGVSPYPPGCDSSHAWQRACHLSLFHSSATKAWPSKTRSTYQTELVQNPARIAVACFALHSPPDDSGMRLSVSQTGLAHLLLIGSVLSRLKGGTGSKRDKKMLFRTGT